MKRSDLDLGADVTSEERAKFSDVPSRPETALHRTLSAYIGEVTGGKVDLSPGEIRAVLAIHGTFQKSAANRNREGYRPRTLGSIARGGATTATTYAAKVEAEKRAEAARLADLEREAAEEAAYAEAAERAGTGNAAEAIHATPVSAAEADAIRAESSGTANGPKPRARRGAKVGAK